MYRFITKEEMRANRKTSRKYDSMEYFKKISFQHEQAVGFAIKRKFIEQGAERVTFELTEIDRDDNPVGEPLVGKMSRYEVKSDIEFNLNCGIT